MKNIYLTLLSTALLLPTYATAGAGNGGGNPGAGGAQSTGTIPEPSIIALLGIGIAAVLLIKKFKK